MGVDLTRAWDQVIATIAAQFPGFNVEAGEDADRERLVIPAILVDLVELEPEPDQDPETGELPVLVHFEARVILGFRTVKVRRAVASAAGALAAFLHDNRLGVKWGAGVVLSCAPDEFAPQAEKVDVWSVEWVHRAHIGDAIELEEGDLPTEVYLSWAPEIGTDHEDDYQEVTNGE